MTESSDDIESFTGDAAGATILRSSLRQLAELETGTPLAARIGDVLAGRLGMRELADDPDLTRFAQQGMREFDELWSQLGPTERAEALAAGEAYEAGLDRRA